MSRTILPTVVLTSAACPISVLIGRFEPFHNGHLGLLHKALQMAPQTLVILGSAHQAPSPRNPFTAAERETLIRLVLSDSEQERVQFLHQRDYWNTQRWAEQTRRDVETIAGQGPIFLVGHHKDSSSHYLDHFPEWTYVGAGSQGDIDATQVRDALFEERLPSVESLVPPSIFQWLTQWQKTPLWQELREEHLHLKQYREQHGAGPFVTVDCLVEASHHVLLVRRGHRPGKGLIALPGRFLMPNETTQAAALVALREETGLDWPPEGALVAEKVFAHPGRSLRARIITHVSQYRLALAELPSVRGGEDSASAFWLPVADLSRYETEFFEDHFHILDQFLGVLNQH